MKNIRLITVLLLMLLLLQKLAVDVQKPKTPFSRTLSLAVDAIAASAVGRGCAEPHVLMLYRSVDAVLRLQRLAVSVR